MCGHSTGTLITFRMPLHYVKISIGKGRIHGRLLWVSNQVCIVRLLSDVYSDTLDGTWICMRCEISFRENWHLSTIAVHLSTGHDSPLFSSAAPSSWGMDRLANRELFPLHSISSSDDSCGSSLKPSSACLTPGLHRQGWQEHWFNNMQAQLSADDLHLNVQ